MIDTVLFDCDGVLIDTEMLALDLEVDYLAERGLIYDRLAFAKAFIGTASSTMKAAIAAKYESELGAPMPATFFEDMHAMRDAHFAKHLQPIRNVKKSLMAWDGKRAVASSSEIPKLKKNLTQTGLADIVYPHVYSAQMVEKGKPAPDVFLYAAKQLNSLPDTCIVIEDSINGVRAGRAAGMTVWGFLGGGHVWPELADNLRAAGAHDIISDHDALSARLIALQS